jgi:hypothetical protein
LRQVNRIAIAQVPRRRTQSLAKPRHAGWAALRHLPGHVPVRQVPNHTETRHTTRTVH